MQKSEQKGKKQSGKIVIEQDLCTGCSLCVAICPKQVLALDTTINARGYHPIKMAKEGCTGCALCARMCPHAAIVEVWR